MSPIPRPLRGALLLVVLLASAPILTQQALGQPDANPLRGQGILPPSPAKFDVNVSMYVDRLLSLDAKGSTYTVRGQLKDGAAG